MKKILPVILVLILVLATLTACVDPDPITLLKEKLANITTATTVKHTIEVLAGTEQLSLQENTYQVSGSSVQLTSKTTELNPNYPIDGVKTITTTEEETLTVQQFHSKIPHSINLTMESLVADSYSATASGNTITHKMTILPQHIAAFLEISSDQASTITNLQVTVVEFTEHITSMTLTYQSTTGNKVTITYSFTF